MAHSTRPGECSPPARRIAGRLTRVPQPLRGAAAGVVGTVAMSIPMLLARRFGVSARLPPEVITGEALDLPPGPRLDVAASAAHVAFGAVAGAAMSALPATRNGRLQSVIAGVGSGLAIWASSYQGWIPLLRLLPPPRKDDPGRRRTMIGAHLVFGVVTALVIRWLERATVTGSPNRAG